MGLLHKGKDKVISLVLKGKLDDLIKDFGEVKALTVNTKEKVIAARIALKGESAPYEVLLRNYRFRRDNGKYYFMFDDLGTSREWVNVVLSKVLKAKQFEVPSQYAEIAEKLM
jgi:ribose 1,5-bisphosphokinase PhnN